MHPNCCIAMRCTIPSLLFHPDLSEAFLLPLKTHFPAFLTGFPFCLLGSCLNHNSRNLTGRSFSSIATTEK